MTIESNRIHATTDTTDTSDTSDTTDTINYQLPGPIDRITHKVHSRGNHLLNERTLFGYPHPTNFTVHGPILRGATQASLPGRGLAA